MPQHLTNALVPALALTLLASAAPRTRTQAVVYGDDDRVLVPVDAPGETGRLADAVLMVVRADDAGLDDVSAVPTLAERAGLCEGERFATEPSLGVCSSVLIAPDVVLTAGHCVDSVRTCERTIFVRGWRDGAIPEAGALSAAQRYRCAALIGTEEGRARDMTLDYALVRLDRPVVGVEPVSVGAAPATLAGPLAHFGYPNGVPLVRDGDVRVEDARATARDYFVLAADSFEGGSGGPVFDADGLLVGILVRGEPDFVEDGECRRVRAIDGPGLEEATRVEWPLRALCAADPTLQVCADCGARCLACPAIGRTACGEGAPSAWTCAAGAYASDDGCDCDCGAPDPDCALNRDVYGCDPGLTCDPAGACVSAADNVPADWTCAAGWFDDGATCHDACGTPDPDCIGSPRLPRGCSATRTTGPLAPHALLSLLTLALLGRRRSAAA